MSTTRSIAALAAAALLAVPSVALALGPPANPGNGHANQDHAAKTSNPATAPSSSAGSPGPNAPAGAKARAYGRLCQGSSKQHVAGEKGTAFSRCVTAMAKAAHGTPPAAACASLSHRHTAGEKGTPFSRCVVAARHLADRPATPAGA